MNRDQKAAVIEEVAEQIKSADAVFAVDYRGISVQQAADLRVRLGEAGARFRVVKNRLTKLSADKAGAESLKELLDEGPTAFTFVAGDAAVAARAIATFRREHGLLQFKGGTMGDEVLTVEQLDAISKLPARDVLHGQLVGTVAAPLSALVRGLASMISGLAIQLQQIQEQGLVSGEAPAEEAPAEEKPAEESPAAEEEKPAEEAEPAEEEGRAEEAEQEAGESAQEETGEPEPSEAPGDPVAEAEAAEEESSEAPSEGERESEEG
jgi:large subunit ribosomal protein L10